MDVWEGEKRRMMYVRLDSREFLSSLRQRISGGVLTRHHEPQEWDEDEYEEGGEKGRRRERGEYEREVSIFFFFLLFLIILLLLLILL
jgi:hypothetical protein